MRKILLITLLIVLCVLSGYTLLNSLQISTIEILGLNEITNKNDNLDSVINDANKASAVTYKDTLKLLDESSEKLKKQKEEYDNYIINVNENHSLTKEVETYEIEYLWTKIGNYATDENVIIKMDVAVSNATLGLYNLNFAVTGKYISIIDFIYDLENDSSLSFKIEEFLLKTNTSEEELIATFVCKDININIDSTSITNSNSVDGESSNSTNSTKDGDATSTTNTQANNANTNSTSSGTSTNSTSSNTSTNR